METPSLGKLITGNVGRDAIHVAIAPVTAGEDLRPGERVGFVAGCTSVVYSMWAGAVGIVDPFLTQLVKKGERFWLCLFPGTVTSLRHQWTHPSFPPAKLKEAASA